MEMVAKLTLGPTLYLLDQSTEQHIMRHTRISRIASSAGTHVP